jgi:hypothetical protein
MEQLALFSLELHWIFVHRAHKTSIYSKRLDNNKKRYHIVPSPIVSGLNLFSKA